MGQRGVANPAEGQRREHVEVAAAGTLGLVGRDAQMIGDEERVEAGLLGDSRAGPDRGAIGLRTHIPDGYCKFQC